MYNIDGEIETVCVNIIDYFYQTSQTTFSPFPQ